MRRPVLLAAGLLFFSGCGCFESGPPKARKGSWVKVEYSVEVDGREVDSTRGRGAVEFQTGKGKMLVGLEEGLYGLRAGEEKTLLLPPEKAYGLRDPAAVQRIPRARFGEQASQLRPGVNVQGLRNGRFVTARVVEADARDVALDFNHPYAGKTLKIRLKVLSVEPPSRRKRA
ncbi:MAG: peptidylprolyl isomerase [Elusimicrobiota bacterium]|jgi:FKBP-type peptidyl-prolyl cis-trans isomerase SlpA